jgi:hypothetical protein
MVDAEFIIYKQALNAGILDGLARSFYSELHKFKDYYRCYKGALGLQ